MASTHCSVYLSLMSDGEYLISLTYPLLFLVGCLCERACSCALFEVKLFLSGVHQDTSGEDLEAGSLGMKSDLKGQIQQRKQLVKDNFDCFVSCKTTIDGILVYIESKLKQIEDDPKGSWTSQLFDMMQGVNSMASCAFEPLFERQAQTEKIRTVQGMLQRFITLFNLPSMICGSISNGEYNLAVRKYKKTKSIVLPSH
ncbi:hypothetical protein Ddye_021779, partial [Dipteronia dyeriana]